MTGGSQANRDAGRGGNYGGSKGSSSSKGSSGGSSSGARYVTHKGGDRGRITKVEKTPSGDKIIEITKDDGTTHRDYATYFK